MKRKRKELKWEEQAKQRLEEIYRAYGKLMMRVAMDILHQREDAEDAVQNSIISIARHMDVIGKTEDYRTVSYICAVVRHAAIDIYRKKGKQDASYDEILTEPAGNFDIEREVCEEEGFGRIVAAINKLDVGYREVLSLFYLNELSPGEIADVLSRPYNTIRSQINRGRKLLRQSLKDI
ncbi:MAG: sigma-70 family RNA polymerase sigma factor [Lachnospiraceae bacterium]|nr:sigma-70 family RNA polymerase sigma factor [Lachnospiraceae bacterium]